MAGTIDFQRSNTVYGTVNAAGEYTITSTEFINSTDQTNVVSTTLYNANGWVIRTDSDDTWSTTQYDKRGQAIRTESNSGYVSLTEYDKLGRTIKTVGDAGTAPEHKNKTTLTEYDIVGNVLESTDAVGVVTVTVYDAASRPLSVQSTDSSTTPATVIESTYQYDQTYDGKVYTQATDALGHVKKSYYDKCGQLVKEVDCGDPGNATEMITLYTYDDKGNLLTKTAPDNSVITYEYNDDDSLKKTMYNATFFVEYAYDTDGNQLSMSQTKDGAMTTKEWVYDDQGRVIDVKQDSNTIVKYAYDKNDNITEMWYPQSSSSYRKIGYTYDYNHDGRLTAISDVTDEQNPKLIRSYTYNSDGDLVTLQDYRKFDQTVNDGDYTEQAFTYDATDGSLLTVTYTDKDFENGVLVSSTTRESYALEYDTDSGNITEEAINTNYGTPVSTVKEYEYDKFGRLLTEKVNSATTASYTYDNGSNRLTMTAGSSTMYYAYDEFNSLTQTASDANFLSLISSYTYDGRGNQTSQEVLATDTVTTYAYDLANQLASVSERVNGGTSATLATYWYDGAGQRTKKVAGSSPTRYYYDGLSLLYTDDGTTQRLEENLMEPGGSVFVTKRFTGSYAGNHYFFRQDIRGSISNVVNRDGTVMVGQSYDAYGVTTKTGATDFIMNFAYTGAVIDGETGLYYMNARYYEPETGSFLTRDTVEGQLAYAYCNGNPVNNTDPTGHCPNPACTQYGTNHYNAQGVCMSCGYGASAVPPPPPTYNQNMASIKYKNASDAARGPNFKYRKYGSFYYCQGDFKHSYAGETIATGGCMLVTLAMIASTYEYGYYTPLFIHHNVPINGLRGAVDNFCKYFGYKSIRNPVTTGILGKYNGLNNTKSTLTSVSKFLKYLDDGYLIIKHERWEEDGGHYIMLLGYKGKYYSFDPGWAEWNGVEIPANAKHLKQVLCKWTDKKGVKHNEMCWKHGGVFWNIFEYWVIIPKKMNWRRD